MAEGIHPAATHKLPPFVTAPGETDVLLVVMAFILLAVVIGFGVLYFRLHSLPDHIAHKSQKVQLEIVGVLGLISLFTNMHIFWIIGLLLAFIEIPDFGTPLNRIAISAEKMAGISPDGAPENAHQKNIKIDEAAAHAKSPSTPKGV